MEHLVSFLAPPTHRCADDSKANKESRGWLGDRLGNNAGRKTHRFGVSASTERKELWSWVESGITNFTNTIAKIIITDNLVSFTRVFSLICTARLLVVQFEWQISYRHDAAEEQQLV